MCLRVGAFKTIKLRYVAEMKVIEMSWNAQLQMSFHKQSFNVSAWLHLQSAMAFNHSMCLPGYSCTPRRCQSIFLDNYSLSPDSLPDDLYINPKNHPHEPTHRPRPFELPVYSFFVDIIHTSYSNLSSPCTLVCTCISNPGSSILFPLTHIFEHGDALSHGFFITLPLTCCNCFCKFIQRFRDHMG
jgi:hypothetical protein